MKRADVPLRLVPMRPSVGDDVVAVVRGKVVDYDHDAGEWTVVTDGADHLPWSVRFHWAQPFYEVQS